MAHDKKRSMSNNDDSRSENVESRHNDRQEMLDELADANHEIENLKLQIAWLERPFD